MSVASAVRRLDYIVRRDMNYEKNQRLVAHDSGLHKSV